MKSEEFSIYKGLQRPLVFKVFKGRFIYWAMGSLMAGILVAGLVSAFISSIVGIVSMMVVAGPLLMYTISEQKKGLYVKRKDVAIYIIPPKHHIHYEKDNI